VLFLTFGCQTEEKEKLIVESNQKAFLLICTLFELECKIDLTCSVLPVYTQMREIVTRKTLLLFARRSHRDPSLGALECKEERKIMFWQWFFE
jgi:hypothetical protein